MKRRSNTYPFFAKNIKDHYKKVTFAFNGEINSVAALNLLELEDSPAST